MRRDNARLAFPSEKRGMATILCVDDEPNVLGVIERSLETAGHRTIGVTSVNAALGVLQAEPVELIVSDYRMPDATGLELLQQITDLAIDAPLIMLTGDTSVEHAVAAMKAGALDYVTKPIRADQLRLVVEQTLEFLRMRRSNTQLRQAAANRNVTQIVGEGPAIRAVLERIQVVARTRATILIQGRRSLA